MPRHRLGALLRSLVALGGVPVVLAACAMVGGGVAPSFSPPPVSTDVGSTPAARVASAEGDVDRLTTRVVDVALQAIGTPYQWGGTGSNGFDCSGLIRFAYGRVGIRLPRTSADQLRTGIAIAPRPSLLRPGDILGFSGDAFGKADHVGLFIGADQFIHSGSSGVRVSSLRNPYWQERLVAARRPVA